MHKQKARVPKKANKTGTHPLAVKNPFLEHPNSEAYRIWELLNNGDLTSDKLTLMDSNGIMDVTMFYKAFAIVANPIHPDNNWRSVVEKMAIGKDVYYRLATEIPISVIEYWKEHGCPPACGWKILDPGALPAEQSSEAKPPHGDEPPKPAAKKPKTAVRKSSAKKSRPSTPAEEHMAQVKKLSALFMKRIRDGRR